MGKVKWAETVTWCKNKDGETLYSNSHQCPMSGCRITHKDTPAKCSPSKLTLNLGRVVFVKDPFLDTHQGSVSGIHLVSKASKGEVLVSRESAVRLGIRRAFKFSPKSEVALVNCVLCRDQRAGFRQDEQ